MDDRFRAILDNLPELPARSILDPYRDLIVELRQRKRTYREIARILTLACQCRVAPSTVYRYLRAQSRSNSRSLHRRVSRNSEVADVRQATKVCDSLREVPEDAVQSTLKEIQQRISALKSRATPGQSAPALFSFDPNEPLSLPPKRDKN